MRITNESRVPSRLSRIEATRLIRAALCHDQGLPEEERRLGFEEATRAIRHDFECQAELIAVVQALAIGRLEALMVLQTAAHVRRTPAGRVHLSLFVEHVLGASSGGLDGAYADGYFVAFAMASAHVRSVH